MDVSKAKNWAGPHANPAVILAAYRWIGVATGRPATVDQAWQEIARIRAAKGGGS